MAAPSPPLTAPQNDNKPYDQDSENEESDNIILPIERFALLYAVLCTSDVPTTKINDYIEAIRRFCPPTSGTVLRLVTSKSDFSSSPDGTRQIGGTRPPVPDFSTPFKGYSITELRTVFLEGVTNSEEEWAESCFVVLDERFVQDNTVLLVTAELDEEEQILDHRCDAKVSLNLLIAYEERRIGLDFYDPDDETWDVVSTTEDFFVLAGAIPKVREG